MTTTHVESVARRILAANGEPNPHPDLLADTVREVEYHGVPAEFAETEAAEVPEYRIIRQELELPCEHPACDTVHRHLYNASYDRPQLVTLYDMTGTREIGTRWESRYHMKHRTEWAVVGRDGFAVASFPTKREAKAELEKLTR